VAVALPEVLVTVPVLVTVLTLVRVPVKPDVAPSLAPPVVTAPGPPFVMVVVAVSPVPLALPVTAEALSAFTDRTICVLDAAVLPAAPDPEFAPPAASTVPTVAVVLFPPTWPVAVAAPVVLVAVPVLVTVLVLVVVLLAPELEPVLAPPVVVAPPPPLLTVVVEFRPVPLALPLDAVALLVEVDPTLWLFVAVVLPLEAEPLLAPPAAFTVPVLALVLLDPL
jgi:hypothetical protein